MPYTTHPRPSYKRFWSLLPLSKSLKHNVQRHHNNTQKTNLKASRATAFSTIRVNGEWNIAAEKADREISETFTSDHTSNAHKGSRILVLHAFIVLLLLKTFHTENNFGDGGSTKNRDTANEFEHTLKLRHSAEFSIDLHYQAWAHYWAFSNFSTNSQSRSSERDSTTSKKHQLQLCKKIDYNRNRDRARDVNFR